MSAHHVAASTVEQFPHIYIGGEWVNPASGRTIESINPATGEVWANVAEGDERDIDLAVQAARNAFEGEWSRKTPSERGLLLRRYADLLSENVDRIATLDTKDNGKLIKDSIAEINNGVNRWSHLQFSEAYSIVSPFNPETLAPPLLI